VEVVPGVGQGGGGEGHEGVLRVVLRGGQAPCAAIYQRARGWLVQQNPGASIGQAARKPLRLLTKQFHCPLQVLGSEQLSFEKML
jgi:hypothetical protein